MDVSYPLPTKSAFKILIRIQRQLGHRQAAYALQYARVTMEELAQVLDDR